MIVKLPNFKSYIDTYKSSSLVGCSCMSLLMSMCDCPSPLCLRELTLTLTSLLQTFFVKIMTYCDIISAKAGKVSRFVIFFNKCMSCENGVVKTIAFICISNHMSRADNNYKLLFNDQNEFGVLDMIEWKMKYTGLIDNVYVFKEMIDA